MVSVNPRRIEQHLVLHDSAPESRIVGYPGNRFVGSLNNPILNSFQFLRTAIWTFEDVAINQSAGAEQGGHAWSHASGKSGLRNAFENDLPREVVIGAVFESENYVRKAVERDRTHHYHARDAVHLEFDRKRYQPLDFFRCVVRPLGNEFDLGRR